MSYEQFRVEELISAIQKKVESKTDFKCYDTIPENVSNPFYFIEMVEKSTKHSKTMWNDVFIIWIHCIEKPEKSPEKRYELIQKLEEALTEDIELSETHELIMQTNGGIQMVKEEETKEKHAVVIYKFMVCYGFKFKV